jgi:RNA polymerase sigma factor (TIGR02999 family)
VPRPDRSITQLLQDWNQRVPEADERLVAEVYQELKRQARVLMSRERSGHTLQPTALVNEAFLKLRDGSRIEWVDRGHFFGVVSRLMRQILVDHARSRNAGKRGDGAVRLSIDDVNVSVEERAGVLLDVDHALTRLAAIDPRQAEVVEMRFFGGLANDEIAAALGVSLRTVVREWESARLWLYRELRSR